MVHLVVVEHLEVLVQAEALEHEELQGLLALVDLREHLVHQVLMGIQDVHMMIFIILVEHFMLQILMYQHH
jgi:hypothetical protein